MNLFVLRMYIPMISLHAPYNFKLHTSFFPCFCSSSICHPLDPCSFSLSHNIREVIPLRLLRIGLPTPVMSLLGGAECSAAVNPLSQFSKHLNEDQSLQRDRLTEHVPNGRQDRFRSQKYESNQDEVNFPLCICHIIS